MNHKLEDILIRREDTQKLDDILTKQEGTLEYRPKTLQELNVYQEKEYNRYKVPLKLDDSQVPDTSIFNNVTLSNGPEDESSDEDLPEIW